MGRKRGQRELSENQQKIRQIYLCSNLTYDKFAEILGIKRNTFAKWVNGYREPSDMIVYAIETKMKDIIKGSDNK